MSRKPFLMGSSVRRELTRFHPGGIALAADHAEIAGLKPVAFRLERRGEIAYSENLYASLAPLPTNAHLALLTKLEKLGA